MRWDSRTTWIRSALSNEQLQPFKRSTPNASILAAAGSGKTNTLVHLLAADLALGVPASGIIAFTFTEKAGEELLARIHDLVARELPGVDLRGIYIGTIHGWCFQYILKHRDFYNFTSVDELHLDALVSRLYDTLNLTKVYGLPYPKAIPKFLADLEIYYNEHLPLSAVPSKIKPSIDAFLKILMQNRLITFGGMVRTAAEQLTKAGPVAELLAIYVDEYQDVNPAQVALVKVMSPSSAKIVAVGDDLQCIYQWRGSDVTRILRFDTDFPSVSVHRLTTNFRSRPTIVNLANNIADKISLRDPLKNMRSARKESTGIAVHWISLTTEKEQSKAVTKMIKQFKEKGVPWNRMAILLRSVNSWGGPFVEELKAQKVPFVCPMLSRGGAFIDEVAIPILGWLRKEHPEPRNKIEVDEAEAAANALWNSVRPWINVPNGEFIFWENLNDWFKSVQESRSEAYNVRSKLYDFLNQCKISVKTSDHSLLIGLGITSQIIRSVEEIHRRRIEGQARRTARGVISEIYHALVRRKKDFGESIPIEQVGDGVLVTTIHQSKGLEWPIVFIPMLVERRFPVTPSGHGTSYPDEIANRYGTTLDDERRLFYVAVTRAKERLFLIDPLVYNKRKRSIFLKDLESKGLAVTESTKNIDPHVWHIDKKNLRITGNPPLRIGLSDLLLYLECPFQFGLRRVVGIEPSVGDELGYGKSLHELIQRRLEEGRQWTEKELRHHSKKHVFLPYMPESGEQKSRVAIESRLKELEHLGLLSQNVETELKIEVILESGVVYGIIDLVHLNNDNSLLVRDWKSNIHEDFLIRYTRQIQFYVFALRKAGRIVKAADIVDVAESTLQKKLVTREVDISEKAITILVRSLNLAMKEIVKGSFPACPSPSGCTICDMERLCSERVNI